MDRAEADLDPVPSVDRHDQQGELYLLLLRELFRHRFIDIVGRVRLGDQRQGFGPAERGTFALAVERRFAPGVEQIQALLRLALFPGAGGMHVKTKRADRKSKRLNSSP